MLGGLKRSVVVVECVRSCLEVLYNLVQGDLLIHLIFSRIDAIYFSGVQRKSNPKPSLCGTTLPLFVSRVPLVKNSLNYLELILLVTAFPLVVGRGCENALAE